ncbi:legumain isoform X2 [Lepeophtheirus salmonis]|uniref:legumain isoform X2 n=1 Tax=Lepeophtheirus salmonis TaxID=72036 RepID=UPI001AEB1ED7|nr:legumain-like isoform X2 [Lepeophtheirus salmonis]
MVGTITGINLTYVMLIKLYEIMGLIQVYNIIVMMYDDIAFNKLNPTPGVLINKPHGPNVYEGIKADYTGKNVRPDIFIKVLEGTNPGVGSQKVIDSGPQDRIFVYFADHGAPGILGFNSHVLQANELIEAVERMHKKKRFDKMVFYVEACEAGSMFANILPKYVNVYAMTATNSKRPSYACYYSEELKTYLGDVFSVNWMEDSDVENLHQESIKRQFHIVKNETKQSKVSQYGNRSISHISLAEIQGDKTFVSNNLFPREPPTDYLPSRGVNMDIIIKNGNSELIEYTRAKKTLFKRNNL